MARVQYGTVITGIAGSIGGTTYSVNRSGATAKARSVGKRNINHNQSVSLSLALKFTKAWNSLTTAQKNEFNAYSLVNTFTDRYGREKVLTGFQWFKNLCQTSSYFNDVLITTPAAFAIPDALPVFDVVMTADIMRVDWSTPIDTDTTAIYIYATPPIRGNARTQRSTYRQLDVRALDVSSSFYITDAWSNVFGMDYSAIALLGVFNINVLIFAVNKSSLVTGAGQFTTGSLG